MNYKKQNAQERKINKRRIAELREKAAELDTLEQLELVDLLIEDAKKSVEILLDTNNNLE